jgi:pyruvate-formate lyase-activating enzyme
MQEKNIALKLEKFKEELDSISPSMCFAKWKQVTLHLHNGHNHSCHHPRTHKTPLEELINDPSALHNTLYKKQQQQLMLDGKRPSECDYCWRVEDNNTPGVYSDRYLKSMDRNWASPYKDEIVKKRTANTNPSYLEVSFSNACNFKCSYCSPEISSKWMEEIKQHGPYPTSDQFNNIEWIKSQHKMPIPEREENPYVEAFWKWWPNLYPDLKVLRVTGGEPLMTKHTFKILDYVLENPRDDLELNINSNLCVPDNLVDNLIEKLKRIYDKKSIKSFKIFTSCEAHGKKAEYIRHGLNYNKWLDTCDKLLSELPKLKITIMSTYNALSVTSYTDFLKDVLALRIKHNSTERRTPFAIDTPYLRYPPHQSIFILTPQYVKNIEDQVTFLHHNKQHSDWNPLCGNGFYDYEINGLKIIYHLLKNFNFNEETITKNRKDFIKFVDEHDRRRGTNFLDTFPEMNDFYHFCKSL